MALQYKLTWNYEPLNFFDGKFEHTGVNGKYSIEDGVVDVRL
jgi:hypothetical protein